MRAEGLAVAGGLAALYKPEGKTFEAATYSFNLPEGARMNQNERSWAGQDGRVLTFFF